MAGTFYKYAERNIETQINWAEVGRTVTDMLNEEVRLREQKKQAIDDATREQLKVIENKPLGEQQGLNEYMMGLGDDLTQTVLMQDRLLKSGQLKLKDYLTTRQNLSDDTNTMFDVAQQLQTTYKDAMDRYKSGQSQETEAWLMQTVQGLAKFTGTKPIVNPATGRIEVTGLVKDASGQMVPDPNNTFSIRELLNFTKTKLDKFQHQDATTTAVDGLGEEIYSDVKRIEGSYKMYKITEYEDITSRANLSDDDKDAVAKYFEWEKDTIGEMVENPYNRLSILTNAVRGYEPTWSEEEAAKDPKKVLIRRNDDGSIMPEFSEEQKKVSERFLQTEIRMKLDKKVTTAIATEPIPPPKTSTVQEEEFKQKQLSKKAADIMTDYAMLYYGDDAQVDTAIQNIRSFNPNIRYMDRIGKSKDIEVVFADGTQETISFESNGKLRNYKDWVTSTFKMILPEDYRGLAWDVNEAFKMSGAASVENPTFNAESEGRNRGVYKATGNTLTAFKNVVANDIIQKVVPATEAKAFSSLKGNVKDKEIAKRFFVTGNEEKTAANIDAIFSAYGVTAEEGDSVWSLSIDYITITVPPLKDAKGIETKPGKTIEIDLAGANDDKKLQAYDALLEGIFNLKMNEQDPAFYSKIEPEVKKQQEKGKPALPSRQREFRKGSINAERASQDLGYELD
ncbi:MAG: hypothetical protein ACK5DE_12205 [Bacteroidota bacterium]|jgi:hypothetical protein